MENLKTLILRYRKALTILLLIVTHGVSFISGYFANEKDFIKRFTLSKKKQVSITQIKSDFKPDAVTELAPVSDSGAPCELYVDVSGAVVSPGVYCLKNGDMWIDAILKAGDFNRDSYAFKHISQNVNLAGVLKPHQKVYIPFQDDVVCNVKSDTSVPKVGDSSNDTSESDSEGDEENLDCISINNAELDELTEIPGVGPSTAQKIIDGRPYKKLEDLKNVKGIGDATFEKMEGQICL